MLRLGEETAQTCDNACFRQLSQLPNSLSLADNHLDLSEDGYERLDIREIGHPARTVFSRPAGFTAIRPTDFRYPALSERKLIHQEPTVTTIPDPSSGTAPAMEMAHVLFMDIVAYSKLPMDQQQKILSELQEAVRNTEAFARAHERTS